MRVFTKHDTDMKTWSLRECERESERECGCEKVKGKERGLV